MTYAQKSGKRKENAEEMTYAQKSGKRKPHHHFGGAFLWKEKMFG